MRFSLFHIPIRIKPGFVLLSVAIGLFNVMNPALEPIRVQLFAGVVVATFGGVLIHELGHAIEARRAGASPDVTLNLLGGVTRFQARRSHWRNLWITSAGIVYQLTAAGLVYVSYRWGPLPADGDLPAVIAQPDVVLVAVLLRTFVLLNVFFALVNLVPVGSLDGGAMIEHFLKGVRVKHAGAIMFVFYSLVGIAVAIWALVNEEWWILAVVVYLTAASLRQQAHAMKTDGDAAAFPDAEQRGRQLLAAGDDDELLQWARDIRTQAHSPAYAVFGATWELTALRRAGDTNGLSALLDDYAHAVPAPVAIESFEACGAHSDIVARYHTLALSPDADPSVVVGVAKALVEVGRPQDAAELAGLTHLHRLHPAALVEVHERLCRAGAKELAEGLRQSVLGRKDCGYGFAVQMLREEGRADEALQRLKREIEDSIGGNALAWLSWALAEDGRSRESEDSMERAIRLGGIQDGTAIQYALDRAAHIPQALLLGEWLLTEGGLTEEERSVVAFNHAIGLIDTGDISSALEMLAEVDGTFLLAVGIGDPDLDPVRGLPEFREMCERAEVGALMS